MWGEKSQYRAGTKKNKINHSTEKHQLKRGYWCGSSRPQRFIYIPPQHQNQHWISERLVELQHGNTVQEGEVQLRIQGKHTTCDKCLKELLGFTKHSNKGHSLI